LCKVSPAAETVFMAMTQPNPRPEPDGGDPRQRIDWSAALAAHDRWLRTVVYARLGQWQAVEEVMQDVSLAAVRQHAPIADAEKVAPWLYRLAVTHSLLYRRKQGRGRKLIDRYAQRTRPSESDRSPDPLDWLLAKERGEQVRAALGRLPRRDAEILLLKYTEDWSYRHLARHLGVSQSAVEARLHRARQRLRSELAAVEDVPAGFSPLKLGTGK
jgi:RNA polymerase sigma-70 factor (ECF subfamily)